MKHRCPICKKIVKVPPEKQLPQAKYFPFCSARCKWIDLGAWLDARYKVMSKASDVPPDNSSDER